MNRRSFLRILPPSLLALLPWKAPGASVPFNPKMKEDDAVILVGDFVGRSVDYEPGYVERNRSMNAKGESFVDVEGRWGDLVNSLKARGLVAGVGENRFDPHRTLTRAEAAVLMCRLAGLEPAYDEPFDVGHWGQKWITSAQDNDYMNKVVMFDAPATRADVAVILALALGG